MIETLKKYHMKYSEVINYLFFGVVTTIICLVTYYLLVLTILNPNNPIQLQIANVISWIAAVTVAYITNRKYVFKSKNNNIKKEVIDFTIARIATLFLDMMIMGIGVSLLGLNDKVFKIISQFAVIVGNFILSKIFVFKSDKGGFENEKSNNY